MLRCGKHGGRLFEDVAAADRSYCAWVLREKADGKKLSRDIKAFAKFIIEDHGGVLAVGNTAVVSLTSCSETTQSTQTGQHP